MLIQMNYHFQVIKLIEKSNINLLNKIKDIKIYDFYYIEYQLLNMVIF